MRPRKSASTINYPRSSFSSFAIPNELPPRSFLLSMLPSFPPFFLSLSLFYFFSSFSFPSPLAAPNTYAIPSKLTSRFRLAAINHGQLLIRTSGSCLYTERLITARDKTRRAIRSWPLAILLRNRV